MSQYFYDPSRSSDQTDELLQIINQERQERSEIKKISGIISLAIIAYIVVQNVAALLLKSFNLSGLYESNDIFKNCFNAIFVSVFAVAVPFLFVSLFCKKKYKYPIIPNESISFFRGFLWVAFGLMCCFIANFSVSFLITGLEKLFGLEFMSGEVDKPQHSIFSCIVLIVCISIIPAICEEFAMRCASLQLLRKYGDGFAVLVVSIVFGLLHGNVVQFLFAFIIGAVMGVATIKTNSIVPAIFIHAINNLLSAISLIIEEFFSKTTANTVISVIYGAFVFFGIISFFILKKRGELKKIKNTGGFSLGKKIKMFMFPWMLAPFGYLILVTLITIKKV